MRDFLIKCILFISLILASIYLVFMQADGYSDPFYKRFTSPKQNSLILGSSRSAQALMPSVLNKKLKTDVLYNYSFTYNISPYGPTYLESIKQKLDANTKDGIFIVTVDPWVISSSGNDPNDELEFDEKALFLGSDFSVNQNPNFSYLINNYDEMYIKILFSFTNMYVHNDGWLEVTSHMSSKQREEVKKVWVANYKEKIKKFKFSQTRVNYLEATVKFLKAHGHVFLVRLPVSDEFKAIENDLMSKFDDIIQNLANENEVSYLNMFNLDNNIDYIDGHHITSDSRAVVSGIIGDWINTIKK